MNVPFDIATPGALQRTAALFAVALLAAANTVAHSSLEKYLRETVALKVSPGNVDVTLHFSVPADLSLAERQQMDRDHDKRISKEEQAAYLKALAERAERMLRLSLNGKVLPLIPLEDAKLDLQDAPGVDRHPHELRLTYFARIPKTLENGATLRLDSGLWTDIPLMVSVSAQAEPGIRLRASNAQGLVPPAKKNTLVRMAEIQCFQVEPSEEKDGRK